MEGLGFNITDWAILVILVASSLISLSRGFVKEFLSLFLWVFAFILTCVLIYLDYDSTYVLVAALAVIGTSFTVFIVQQVKKLKKKLSENLYKRKQVIDRTKDSSKKDGDDDSSLLGSGAKLSMKVMRNA